MTAASSLETPLKGLALFRIGLGIGAIVAPSAMTRAFRIRPTPELDYMTRIFGARAIALGLGYLVADAEQRTRFQRICVGVDVTDTIGGVGHLVRRDLPLPTVAMALSTTAPAAAIGVARVLSDLRG